MSIKKNDFEKILQEKFPNAQFEVIDTAGDENHYCVKIKSDEFKNMTRLEKHRFVNSSLKDYIGNGENIIHAVEFIIN